MVPARFSVLASFLVATEKLTNSHGIISIKLLPRVEEVPAGHVPLLDPVMYADSLDTGDDTFSQ